MRSSRRNLLENVDAGCIFWQGSVLTIDGELIITHRRHNHEPSHDMASHPTLRRLNADALDQIATMTTNRVPPRAQTAVI